MDPEWKGREYTSTPEAGMSGAILAMMFMVSSPLQWQKNAPTREKSEEMMHKMLDRYLKLLDLIDMMYAFNSSRNYNPSLTLQKLKPLSLPLILPTTRLINPSCKY